MSFLFTEKVSRLTLGIPVLDDIFPGFELGEFVILDYHDVLPMAFSLTLRCQLPIKQGGLDSPIIFIDCGNSFNPYLLAEIARNHGLDYASILEKIYISRVFTAYQFSSLISEKLDRFLKCKESKLLIISDITFPFYREISKDEAENIFNKICVKLTEIAASKRTIVIVNYIPNGKPKRDFFFDALFERANVLIKLRKNYTALSFDLEKHPRVKPFSIDFQTDYASLESFMEV